MTPPVALTVAGTDPSGGAGLQADLKTFAAHGVHGASAITAVVAQNTLGVRDWRPLDPGFLLAQIEAVLDDLPVAAVKTGMLSTAGNVLAVADLADAGRLPNLVVDPVMVAASGDRLLDADAERGYAQRLLPHARVLTPNRREAEVLLGATITTIEDQREAAHALAEHGPRVVVVTGGNPVAGSGREAVDVVWDGQTLRELRAPRVDTANNHGTGCTFAAAVTAGLAHGGDLPAVLDAAKAYVHRAITGAAGWRLGAGHGPVDHFGWAAR